MQTLSLRRLAIQLAAQLPADERNALAVLDYTRELVVGFLREAGEAPHRSARLLPIRRVDE